MSGKEHGRMRKEKRGDWLSYCCEYVSLCNYISLSLSLCNFPAPTAASIENRRLDE